VGKKKNRKSVLIKLNDLRFLAYIFPLVENQLVKYTEAMPDFMNFVLATLNSTSSVDPPANASKKHPVLPTLRRTENSFVNMYFHK